MAERTGYNIDDQYGTYFMTFTFVGWIDFLTRKNLKDLIIEYLDYCQKEKGLIVNAYVLMPSHMHLMCRAKSSSKGLSNVVRILKDIQPRKL